ncbi:hypothetical protein [Actinomadura geliboluensis]|uniref:hypothetical protein n=1 Tax=Actinomadura geliboluensis TaxID=882440 RepID=UPI002603FCF9|nr:hypothetical protein [Actinomadura geliboluensis]
MSRPLTSPTSPPAGGDATLATDLAELGRRARIERRARVAMAAGFVLIAAALTGPALLHVPARVLATSVLLGLAVTGAGALANAARTWCSGRYELALPHPLIWRWRIVRRWYAPGSTVWRADAAPWDGPLTVLGWVADPACPVPWALVYDGTPLMSGGAAEWLPLTALAPDPTEPPDTYVSAGPGTEPPAEGSDSGESGGFGLTA